MTRAQFLRQKREARKEMERLAKLFPGVFTKDGKPIVAELRPLLSTGAEGERT